MRPRTMMIVLGVLFACAGCATPRQSADEVNSGLLWFVPLDDAAGWALADPGAMRLERSPTVVLAWGPSASDGPRVPTLIRSDREQWIAAIKSKLEGSGWVTRVEGSAPETFEGGVTVNGLRTLASARDADLIVLFGRDVSERRYHVSWPTRPVYVVDVIEIRTTARAVGVTSAGRPVFAEAQTGFEEGRTLFESEVREASSRSAVNALADAIVRRLKQIAPQQGAP
ncbi:MAG: hypothetical protein ACOYXR_05185 [Nitrospirota bacterium]